MMRSLLLSLSLLATPIFAAESPGAPPSEVVSNISTLADLENPKNDVQFGPLLVLTPAQWRKAREIYRSEAAAKTAFARTVAVAEAALRATPQPLRELIYEGRVETDPERVATKKRLGDMLRLRALV